MSNDVQAYQAKIRKIFDQYKPKSQTDKEKEKALRQMIRCYLKNDPLFAQNFFLLEGKPSSFITKMLQTLEYKDVRQRKLTLLWFGFIL
jgi:hypothetical protein